MNTRRHVGTDNGSDLIMIEHADEDAAGATVWWALHGDVARKSLVSALHGHGLFEHAPPLREPEVALRRAAGNLRGKRRLLRPLGRKGAWAIVEEQVVVGKDALKHWTGPTVALDKIGRPVLTNATMEEAKTVKDAYEYHLDALTSEDVSSWLIDQVERLGAVALRPSGGIYYLPPAGLPTWRRVVSALTEVASGHRVYKVPTVRMTEDGARAILDSLQSEILAKVEEVTADIVSGELGVRGLETRATRAGALMTKVEEYEALLGTKLNTMRSTLEQLQVDVAAAKLAAEAAAEETAS